MNSKTSLLKIYFNWSTFPGWLKYLEMTGDFTDQDLRQLEDFDLEFMKLSSKARAQLLSDYPNLRKKVYELREEFKDYGKKRRIEFLNGEIEYLQKLLRLIYDEYQKSFKRNEPYWLREAFLEISNVDYLKNLLKRYIKEKMILTSNKEINSKKLTELEISRAIEYPIQNLIEVNSAGFALCPFHKDRKPSLFTKNNFFYCFACGWSGNTIKFLMERDKISFVEAVKRLNY